MKLSFGLDASSALEALSLLFSPRGETKCVRGPSGRGARRLARAGVLEQYVEARQASATKSWRPYGVLRPSGGEKYRLVASNKVEAAYARPDRFERPAGPVER